MEENEKLEIIIQLQKIFSLCLFLVALMAVLLEFFRFSIIDNITSLIYVILYYMLYIFFGIKIIVILVYSLIHRKHVRLKLLFFNFIIVLVLVFVPFTQYGLKFDFLYHQTAREEIIEMIMKNEIITQENNSSTILLPPSYRALSRGGGEILVNTKNQELQVFVYTYRGILSNFSGYYYISSGRYPTTDDIAGEYKNIIKMDNHWYWVSN